MIALAQVSSVLLLALFMVACRSDGRERAVTQPSHTAAPEPTPPAPARPDVGVMPLRPLTYPAHDDLETHKRRRALDPAFLLVALDKFRYRGRVSDECPAGSSVMRPEDGWKLSRGMLEIVLPGGGCPTWAGYTVVAKNPAELSYAARERLPERSMPFYVCADQWHDVCEARLENTWVFDVARVVESSNATTAVFAPPTPSDPDPASLCCCVVGEARDPASWATCEARGGVCDSEPECYGIDGPIP